MPIVELTYTVAGYITRGYDVPQEIIDQGASVVEEYVWDRNLVTEFERDNSYEELEEMH